MLHIIEVSTMFDIADTAFLLCGGELYTGL